jgi:nitrite reductase/ring-hydroxylating ferredoxin subunit
MIFKPKGNTMKAPICHLSDIPKDGAKPVQFFGRDVLVYHAGGPPMAVFNACMHLGGPLERKSESFVCPWHNAEFDCATGMLKDGPAGTHDRLLMLPTLVENDKLMYVYGE